MNSKEVLNRLEEIEARAGKATQGPWTYGESEREQWVEADDGLIVYLEHYSKPDPTVHEQAKYDFDFIAHSRMDVPWLCELTRKLFAVAEAAREFVDVFWKTYGDRPGCEGCFVGEVREIERALAASREVDNGTEPGAA